MLTFFTDESLVNNNDVSIYGGLILSPQKFRSLTSFVYQLKERYSLPQHLELKWTFQKVFQNMKKIGYIDATATRKNNETLYDSLKEDYNQLKGEILDEIRKQNIDIVVVIRPNTLLRSGSLQSVEYSVNAISRKFEKILVQKHEFGIMLADELEKRVRNDEVVDYQYVIDLFRHDSKYTSFNNLISIVPTIKSHVSPIHQINDILLGTIQYYIRCFVDKKDLDFAKEMLGKISGNFYSSPTGRYTINHGIIFYPPKNTRWNTRAGSLLNSLEAQMASDFGII